MGITFFLRGEDAYDGYFFWTTFNTTSELGAVTAKCGCSGIFRTTTAPQEYLGAEATWSL